MNVMVSIPDDFVPASSVGPDLSRQMLEAYAVENYRLERMSLGKIAELLGLSIDQTNAFLKERKIPLNYGLEDLERDRRTMEEFLKR